MTELGFESMCDAVCYGVIWRAHRTRLSKCYSILEMNAGLPIFLTYFGDRFRFWFWLRMVIV